MRCEHAGHMVRSAALGMALLAALAGPAIAIERSASPPAWTAKKAVCAAVSLTSAANPAGVSGPLAGGYNVYELRIVKRSGVSCSRARRLARADWTHGHHRPLRWRQRRAWRSTEGSAYVGDFRGTGSGIVVEYFAIH